MTAADPGNPRRDPEPSQRNLVIANLGFVAVAIAGALIGYLVHAWRSADAPATPQAQVEFAEKVFQGGNNQAALMVFTKLADQNNPIAQYWLGHMTELGLGVPRDPAKAIALYKKAAAQGIVAAESRLGEAYLHGDMVLPDYAQAKTYLTSAAYRGNARAAMLLGQMYRIGLGVAADPKEAYAWSEVATVEGDTFAQRERDASLRELSVADQQAAVARAHAILDDIKRETAAPQPAAGKKGGQ
jgi:TPR repeat protein